MIYEVSVTVKGDILVKVSAKTEADALDIAEYQVAHLIHQDLEITGSKIKNCCTPDVAEYHEFGEDRPE